MARIIPLLKVQTHFFHLVQLETSSSFKQVFLQTINFSLPCALWATFLSFFHSPQNSMPFSQDYLQSPYALNTCPNHHGAFAFAVIYLGTVKPSIVINSLVFFLSINFTLHMDLNIALFVFLKIATFLSFKHHASFAYNITECTQL